MASLPSNKCRLIVDPPLEGALNMAVDEMLLDWSAKHQSCCWRMYAWREPTLSLGYFQDIQSRATHAPSKQCPIVRRITGGGAIVHDLELTYSLVIPGGHPLAVQRDLLYATIHNSLITTLTRWNITASLCEIPPKRSATEEPFLCFKRRASGDVLIGDKKIAGSAQRRRRGAVLQHGSVLLGKSAAAPELPGMAEITDNPPDFNALSVAWLSNLEETLGLHWQAEPLATEEIQQIPQLDQKRYAVRY